MESVNVNGAQLEYEVIGFGEPVLLISPVLADAFRPLLSQPALADHYQLIPYHKRGWVGSTHTPPPVSIADHAAEWPVTWMCEALEVAGEHPLVCANDRQPRVRGRLLVVFGKETVRSREPPAHRRHQRRVQEQVHRDANRRARRRHTVPGPREQRVRALSCLDRDVEMARRVRDLAKQRQIARIRQAVGSGLHEQVVGLVPRSARRRFPPISDAHRATL